MSKAKQERRKQIKAELAQGQKKFVLRHGVLDWGVPTYFLYLFISAIVQMLFYRLSFGEALKSLFPITYIVGIVVFGIAGIFMGRYRWKQLLKEAGGKNKPGKK
ncbi:MAG: hypothetical protein ACOX2G_12725 [Bacillota bacterium]|jgi:VIT1/CCC1 family predicted Fe2+/Mn2+ transporter